MAKPDDVFEKIGAIEATAEGVKAIAPGLSLDKIWGDIKAEVVDQAKFGAHELAAAIFAQSDGFVMYPRAGAENSAQGKTVEVGQEVQPTPTPEVQKDHDLER